MKDALALTLITALIVALAVPATAGSLELANDPATGRPGTFAEEEIRREATAKGTALSKDANATRIAITVEKDDKATAQSYSIRVKNENGRRVGYVDVTALTAKVAADIDIARNWKPGSLKDDGKRAGIGKNFQK